MPIDSIEAFGLLFVRKKSAETIGNGNLDIHIADGRVRLRSEAFEPY